MIVADTVTAAQVLEVVRGAGGALLAGADVFDVYRDAAADRRRQRVAGAAPALPRRRTGR